MTTRSININTKICDFCNSKEHVFQICENCKKDVCYDCRKNNGRELHQSTIFGGNELFYCINCLNSKIVLESKKYLALQKIEDLRSEERRFYQDYRTRADQAEQEVKNILGVK